MNITKQKGLYPSEQGEFTFLLCILTGGLLNFMHNCDCDKCHCIVTQAMASGLQKPKPEPARGQLKPSTGLAWFGLSQAKPSMACGFQAKPAHHYPPRVETRDGGISTHPTPPSRVSMRWGCLNHSPMPPSCRNARRGHLHPPHTSLLRFDTMGGFDHSPIAPSH